MYPNSTNARDPQPHIVIVGGGFGGLAVANALRKAPVRVTVIDRTNHSVFFPLLYQVATGGLSADEVATPIRSLLRRQRNAEVLMTEVTGVDIGRRQVLTADGPITYDYLVLATGARYTYFDHPEWEQHAPSLKSIADAATIRRRLLQAFEQAGADVRADHRHQRRAEVCAGWRWADRRGAGRCDRGAGAHRVGR